MKHTLVQLPNGEWQRVEGSSERDLQEKLHEIDKTFQGVRERLDEKGDPHGKPWEGYGRAFDNVPDWVAAIQYEAGIKSGADGPRNPPMSERDQKISDEATMLNYVGRPYQGKKVKPVTQENDAWKATCVFWVILAILAVVTIIFFR